MEYILLPVLLITGLIVWAYNKGKSPMIHKRIIESEIELIEAQRYAVERLIHRGFSKERAYDIIHNDANFTEVKE